MLGWASLDPSCLGSLVAHCPGMAGNGFSWEDLDLLHVTSDLSEVEPAGGRGLRERAQAHQDLVTFTEFFWPKQIPSLAPGPTLTRHLVLTPWKQAVFRINF